MPRLIFSFISKKICTFSLLHENVFCSNMTWVYIINISVHRCVCIFTGVDFQVKPLMVDGHLVALQVWDTAGQERFRSITKQYFRKADGVLIMYDVTSESSFTNVRNWMDSVQVRRPDLLRDVIIDPEHFEGSTSNLPLNYIELTRRSKKWISIFYLKIPYKTSHFTHLKNRRNLSEKYIFH